MKITNCLLLIIFIFGACSKHKEEIKKQETIESKSKMEFKLISPAFENEGMIPVRYTCDSEDISPPLKWNKTGDDVKSFALIMDDPDAPGGDFVHWVIYNIPVTVTELPEGFSSSKSSGIYSQGKNDFNKLYYRGPCPPPGTHRYYFRLYALDTILELKEGVSKKELLDAMKGHTKDQTELMGKYKRKDIAR